MKNPAQTGSGCIYNLAIVLLEKEKKCPQIYTICFISLQNLCVKTFLTKTMTGFNKVLPDKEGGNFLFFTVYWGVQIYERVHKFCKLMKQIV
jgi:hypothetical protein